MANIPEEKVVDCFSENEITQLKSLATLYLQAKPLILYSEEADPNFRSNLQIVKELRDAFDHVMRVVVVHFGDALLDNGQELCVDSVKPSIGYGEKNIQKAIGHVYRAAFDALDGVVLSLREKIIAELNNIPHDAIGSVLPEYWEIRIKLEELNEKIGQHRARKDIGVNIGKTYDRYVEDVEVLKGFDKKLLHAMPALVEYKQRIAKHEEEIKKDKAKDEKKNTIKMVAIAVLGALIGAFASYALNGEFGFYDKSVKHLAPQSSTSSKAEK